MGSLWGWLWTAAWGRPQIISINHQLLCYPIRCVRAKRPFTATRRWLKCYANFNHLISHSPQGVLLNFYVVVIGILLTYLQTGGRPSKYLFALLGAVASGGATLDEILPILRERERQSALARASAARRRAKKRS